MSERKVECCRECRKVPGFSDYAVCKCGMVFSLKRNAVKKLNPVTATRGRRRVTLHKNGEAYPFLVHRLVLLTFCGPCPAGMEGCHNDRNPTNNCIENLRWDTSKANHADRERHGTTNKATERGASKLSTDDVLAIRNDMRSQRCIASEYGVHQSTVSLIKTRRTWDYV